MDGNLYSQFKPDEASARQKLVRAIIFLAGKLKSRSHGRKGEWVPARKRNAGRNREFPFASRRLVTYEHGPLEWKESRRTKATGAHLENFPEQSRNSRD